MRHWLRDRYDWRLVRLRMKRSLLANTELISIRLKHHVEFEKTLAQIGFGIVTLIGISMYSIPIALIIGGLAGIIAVERQ